MCTPQFQQAIAGAQAAGIIPGQQAVAAGQLGAQMGQAQPQFDPRQNDPRYAGAMASQISELFDPRTGQRIRQVGPAREIPMVPISKEEFDGPVVSDSIQSIAPQPMMPQKYTPMERIQRQPTVGELLGIKPGQYEEVGGPGRF